MALNSTTQMFRPVWDRVMKPLEEEHPYWPLYLLLTYYIAPVALAVTITMLRPPQITAEKSKNLQKGAEMLSETDKLSDQGKSENPDASTKLIPMKFTKEELYRPPIAYPTVVLTLVSFAVWLASFYAYATRSVGALPAWAVSTIATFVIFTPFHDAVHNAVSKYRGLNSLIGTIAGIPLIGPFSLFRFIHLSHHRYCNDSSSAPDGTSLDPDHFTGDGPGWILPFRWSLTFSHYLFYVAKVMYWRSKDETLSEVAREQDRKLLRETLGFLFIVLPLQIALWRMFGDAIGVCWYGSAMSAVTVLALFFDYLPHRPHEISYAESPYKSTSVLTASNSREEPETWLKVVMLNQCLHNIHHLAPFVPFYKYPLLWKNHSKELKELGTHVVPLSLYLYQDKDYLKDLRKKKVE